jgi:hypothetical protein
VFSPIFIRMLQVLHLDVLKIDRVLHLPPRLLPPHLGVFSLLFYCLTSFSNYGGGVAGADVWGRRGSRGCNYASARSPLLYYAGTAGIPLRCSVTASSLRSDSYWWATAPTHDWWIHLIVGWWEVRLDASWVSRRPGASISVANTTSHTQKHLVILAALVWCLHLPFIGELFFEAGEPHLKVKPRRQGLLPHATVEVFYPAATEVCCHRRRQV